MKKLIVVIGFLAIELTGYGQIWLTDALDSTRVRYATFEASSTSGMSADMFFKNYLDLEKPNRLVPSDTLYSPDSAYCHIKYRQYFGKYYVENSRLTLTFHHNNIIRFKGYYLHITTIEEEKYRVEDAIDLYKHYYNISADSCVCRVELLITEDTSPNPKAVLCFKIQSDNPSLMNQLLYVSVSDLSIIKEESIPISGFNATLPTRYNGVRYGQQSGVYPLYELHDNRAAVRIMKIDSGVTNLGTGIPNTFFNKTDIWDNYSDSTYPQHILDAYWAACQYSYYMQDTFHCPKDYFQRTWVPEPEHFEVMDTTTWVYVALNTFIDNTKWMRILYYHQNKVQGIDIMRNIIVIGAPGLNHYPKASIDETVHEYAHIFSHQSWEPKYLVSNRIDNEICEACADIWAAIITNSIYHDETKTWKIGEDVVLPTSGHTCIRNLANPSDSNAEIQMNDNRCQEPGISAYERSGIFSHWFYLLTHGYSGEGCTGGDDRWNEIDIFEFWNEPPEGTYNPNLLSKVINMTAHYDYNNDGQTNMCHTNYTEEDYSEDFHIYALEWEPNRIAWYIDGICIREDFRYYNVLGQPAGCNLSVNTLYLRNKIFPVNPMNIVYNLAIQNVTKGQPDDPTIFPANLYIDWIRYYRRGSNNDINITDSTTYPLNTITYNNIVGNTISFNCPYMINQRNQQCAVAATEVLLSSGFCVEEGGVFFATIDDNSSLRASDTTDILKKSIIDNVKEESPLPNVSIYPTINQGFFSIEISPNDLIYDIYVEVYDMSGNKVLSQSLHGKNSYYINIPNCPNGLYVIQLINNNGVVLKTEKIIISR